MKVTTKTVQDRITILENQKTISLTEEFTLNVFRWALVQQDRAQIAEAKLAELEKQEPVAVVDIQRGRGDGKKFVLVYTGAGHALVDDVYQLFTRPAPAVDLDDLVPDAKPEHTPGDHTDSITHWCAGWNSCRAATLRNIEVSKNGETTPTAKVDSLGKSEVRTQNQALDEKRVEFIQSLAEDPALLSGKSGLLKYKFDQHWFAVDGCRETGTHYVARLRENGVVTHYAKSLYDFREDGEQ